MDRRGFLTASLGGAMLALAARRATAQGTTATVADLPRRNAIRVAFLLGDNTNVIDVAGPWEVFQDVQVRPKLLPFLSNNSPFKLYTVAPTADIVRMTGGMLVQPNYTIEDAPPPHVIVVPAHGPSDASLDWLRRAGAEADLVMAVCTGAFVLARTGMLDGLAATTHHKFWDSFAEQFPKVELRRGLRFVDNGRIATSGGLTSGIDLALHIVKRYFGENVAAETAADLEHTSNGWRDPA